MFRMDNRIVELASHELDLHPEARFDDIYKLFYQGTFGPKHIMEDQEVALRFLAEEIDCDEFDRFSGRMSVTWKTSSGSILSL